jgi:hypothetical protein
MPREPSVERTTLVQQWSHNPLRRGSDRIRRLIIGVGGVLAVLLLIGLASLISDQRATEGQTAAQPSADSSEAGSEPLAEFGVQPSATVPDGAAMVPSPEAPVAKRGSVPDLQPEPATAKRP